MRYRHYLVLGVWAVSTGLAGPAFAGKSANPPACSSTSVVLRQACLVDLVVNFSEASAQCLNMSDPNDRKDCYDNARQDMADARDECGAVYDARQALCTALGQAPYEPHFGEDYADNFVNPLDIGGSVLPNQYYPLVPGTTRVFEDAPGPNQQTDTVTVTHDTKSIDGVTCVVVTDVVKQGGVIIEDTKDWFAQDLQGNVWYCGESSQQLSTFDGDNPKVPELVAIDGSWKAGVNGAKAGIVMAATPQVGKTRRLELSWGEAEDANQILDTAASATTPGASCTHTCLETLDFSPLDAGSGQEHKYYAPGIGVILEVDLETGDRTELQQ
jgi:hypothetical protein